MIIIVDMFVAGVFYLIVFSVMKLKCVITLN